MSNETDWGSTLDSGISDELAGILSAISEASSVIRDRPKYEAKVGKTLVQMVATHYLGKPIYELTWLIMAVLHGYRPERKVEPLLDFFIVSECLSPARIARAFATTTSDKAFNIASTAETLLLDLAGEEFRINAGRVPVLASLFDLVLVVNPRVLDEASLQLETPSRSAVDQFSAWVLRELNAFLKPHLQTRQQYRRARYLWNWLTEKCDVQEVKDQLQDSVVLSFWYDNALNDTSGIDHFSYRKVVDDFFSLYRALDAGQTIAQVNQAAPLGQGEEEVSPEKLFESLQVVDDPEASVAYLWRKPKFLPKENRPLDRFAQAGHTALHLPLTLMRETVLGDWQASLRQAYANKASQRLAELIAAGPEKSYGDYRAHLNSSLEQLRDGWLSGLHVLLAKRDTEVLGIVSKELSPEALRAFGAILAPGSRGGTPVEPEAMQEQATVVHRFFDELSALCMRVPEINRLIHNAKTAFDSHARSGFKGTESVDDTDPYIDGMQKLRELEIRLQRYIHVMSREASPNCEGTFAADVNAARSLIRQRYGVRE